MFYTNPLFNATETSGGNVAQYQLARSIRLRGNTGTPASSPVFSRTPSSTTNTKTFTISFWIKRTILGTRQDFFEAGNTVQTDTDNFFLTFLSDQLRITGYNTVWRLSNQVFRDTTNWYHFVVAVDTTQSTGSNRIRAYANGVELTWSSPTDPALNANTGMNQAQIHTIGKPSAAAIAGNVGDMYFADFQAIDGLQLTPSSFGMFDSTTGQWVPIRYTGSYGTNGFRLDFSDNSNTTATTLGADRSGNGNNFTPANFSVTAGSTNDSLFDTPTDYYDGTNYHGNYAVLNYNAPATGAVSQGGLSGTATVNASCVRSYFPMIKGKWYWEVSGTANAQIGIVGTGNTNVAPQGSPDGYTYYGGRGSKFNNAVESNPWGSTYTTGDTIGVAYDADNGAVYFSKNGTWQNSANPAAGTGFAYNGITGAMLPLLATDGVANSTCTFNFGQRPFVTSPPSGFTPLCAYNIPTPSVVKTSSYFNSLNYTGTAGSQSFSGFGFSPNTVWIKPGAAVISRHFDTVRASGTQPLLGDGTSAEGAAVTGFSIDSDGFTVPANTTGISTTGASFHSFSMKNLSSAYLTMNYTGTGVANTLITHSLGAVPEAAIVRGRSAGTSWLFWHKDMAGATSFRPLQSTTAESTTNTPWGTGSWTSTQFMVTTGTNNINVSGNQYEAYLFRSLPGAVYIGSYTGNGNASGPAVNVGFRPACVMIMPNNASNNPTILYNTAINPITTSYLLVAGTSGDADNAGGNIDLTSTGFKIKATSTWLNTSATVYRFIAFAESPFKYSKAQY